MAMLTDEMSGKNDPYKKPTQTLLSGQDWYQRTMIEVADVLKARHYAPDSFELGLELRLALRRAAGLSETQLQEQLTDKETH